MESTADDLSEEVDGKVPQVTDTVKNTGSIMKKYGPGTGEEHVKHQGIRGKTRIHSSREVAYLPGHLLRWG